MMQNNTFKDKKEIDKNINNRRIYTNNIIQEINNHKNKLNQLIIVDEINVKQLEETVDGVNSFINETYIKIEDKEKFGFSDKKNITNDLYSLVYLLTRANNILQEKKLEQIEKKSLEIENKSLEIEKNMENKTTEIVFSILGVILSFSVSTTALEAVKNIDSIYTIFLIIAFTTWIIMSVLLLTNSILHKDMKNIRFIYALFFIFLVLIFMIAYITNFCS